MLYSMRPSAAQSRLPRLPSLRRYVSMYGIASKRKGAAMRSEAWAPDGGYTSMSSDEALSQAPAIRKGRTLELSESRSGIGWKFANQGLNLLSLAVKESSTISQDPNFGNAPFARQLYLHALAYLLRALPSTLTTAEQLSVRTALPQGVVEPLRVEVSNRQSVQFGSTNTSRVDQPPSLLHRTLASTIVQLFILFQFALPYLKVVLRTACQYERTHKILEKVLSQSIDTVDIIGKRGLSLTGAIYGMADGRVGQALTDAASWLVEGVTGGIHDGVVECMIIMGARRGLDNDRR